MEKEKLNRINELAKKSKTEPLSPEELAEQKALREEYLTEYRQALRGRGGERVVLGADGKKTVVKSGK